MEKKRFNRALFYTYLSSYIAVLVIPLVVLWLVLSHNMAGLLKDEMIGNQLERLGQVQDMVEIKMNELEKIAFRISSNPELTPYNATKNAYAAMNTVSELQDYKAADAFLFDLLLYYRDKPLLYSSEGTHAPQQLVSRTFPYERWTDEAFFETISTLTLAEIRPAEALLYAPPVRIVTSMMPIPYQRTTPYATLVFLIREQALLDLIQRIDDDYAGNTMIVNARGEIITSVRPAADAPFNPQALEGQGTELMQADGSEYFVSYISSARSGWTYATYIDKAAALQQVQQMQRLGIILLLAVLFLGSALIYGSMHLNYNPLRRLFQYTEQRLKEVTPDVQPIRDLDSVRLAVHAISDNSRRLHLALDQSRPALKAQLVTELMRGSVSDLESFNRRGAAVGVLLRDTPYRFVLLLLQQRPPEAAPGGMMELLERELPPGIEGYGMESSEGNMLILACTSADLGEDAFIASMDGLKQRLHAQWGALATVGIGRSYETLAQLGKSYLEASTALDYRLIKGSGAVIVFDEVSEASASGAWYPESELEELRLAVRQGSTSRIEKLLDALIATMKAVEIPLYLIKCICFDLINTLVRTIQEMYPEEADERQRYPDVTSIVQFETVDGLVESLKTASTQLCDVIRAKKESGNARLVETLKAYMQAHYASYSFSLQQMAADMGMSASYISRYFKNQTSLTVTQYIQRLRIERAKELLRGDDNLQSIAEQLGYGNGSSFIRRFKEHEGVTPGEYRKQFES
ncbi:AraC family transcriptional regulator [Paenibacillus sp. IB182496]|uniref:AraC family transcriptional regulator n=1 Tax=Paenibacillus sabuli TaxID=2772509 RepID=A0A927BWS7_9BACL|nr:helix-turn-helix domain-containing protein [Paenibacillus sabuli]MBD2847175.1 AraC family transcriptional regulator [Paenibacillus sabuli]